MPLQERTGGFVQPQRAVQLFEIEPGMLVADFGAGSGAYTHAVADLLHGKGRVYAIDIQKDLLRRIKNEANTRNHQHVDVIWADLERPAGSKLSDELVDRVIMSNVLFQLENKEAGLAEAYRILKPSGRLIVVDWADSCGGAGPHASHLITRDQALELLRGVGFSKYRDLGVGAQHYGLMLPKQLPSS